MALNFKYLIPRWFKQSKMAEENLLGEPQIDPGKEIVYDGDYQVFSNVCPRNCYDSCSMKTYVKNGVIEFVTGAKSSTYTDGGLCVKGYTYFKRVYSQNRIKYPMVQDIRGSGNWRRITWDEAMTRIAEKILSIKQKDGNLLSLCLAQDSGHLGITNNSPQGMMASLGYTTRCAGTPCWPAGIDAQSYDMGTMWCNDPEDMVHSKYIILWGVNPAWCSIHSMKYIFKAREKGAKVIVIDPVFTQTAAKSDLFFQIKTGSDGALALAMAKYMIDHRLIDEDFISRHSIGFNAFKTYLQTSVTLKWAESICGIPEEEISQLAEAYAAAKPATIWIGYGMQRHANGGANVRAIDALGALSGNIGTKGGGVRYGHLTNRIFNYNALAFTPPKGSRGAPPQNCTLHTCRGVEHLGEKGTGKAPQDKIERETDRIINTNQLAREILKAENPPIRLLWVTLRNPFSQDFNRPELEKAFKKLEMVVVVDQFMTQTTDKADIVLPVTSMFEEWSVNVSYWHYWIGINEPAIAPMYECKSNTAIAALLSKKMNELSPGSCTFPTHIDERTWMTDEFNQTIYDMYGLNSWEELKNGPKKAKMLRNAWDDFKFKTPSGKYEFQSELAKAHGHSDIPIYHPGKKPNAPFRVLTPHSKFSIHSQFQNVDVMLDFNPHPYVLIHPEAAKKKGIRENEKIRVKNRVGEIVVKAKLSTNVREDELVLYETWFKNDAYCVQNLVDDTSSDMGAFKTGAPGAAIHDQFADIEKINE